MHHPCVLRQRLGTRVPAQFNKRNTMLDRDSTESWSATTRSSSPLTHYHQCHESRTTSTSVVVVRKCWNVANNYNGAYETVKQTSITLRTLPGYSMFIPVSYQFICYSNLCHRETVSFFAKHLPKSLI